MTKKSWHSISEEQVAKILGTDLEKGLKEEEVKIRQRFGKNVLPEEKSLSRIEIFLGQLRSPLIYILIIAGITTLILREWTDTIVIFTAVMVNAIAGFIQESKASNTLKELKKVLMVRATVFREGKKKEILQENLVPGDIIFLKAGNKVPADGRLLRGWNLRIQEAPLTGEWLAAEKITGVLPQETPLFDRDNMVYMGTTVEDGEGKAVVAEIGLRTEIGKVASLIKKTKEGKTPYQKKLAHFSKILGSIIALVCFLIFIEGMLKGREFREMFVISIAVAVAAIPEGLPVAMTVILALGMQRILKRRGLVRKLASAETLGSTSIIATDKTLTLTEGKMEVAEIKSEDKNLTLKIAALSSDAFIENPKENFERWKIRGRPTDKALVRGAAQNGLEKPALEEEFPKIDELPFNTQNKFIATLHLPNFKGKSGKRVSKNNLLFVSGAPENIIRLSSKIQDKRGQKLINKERLGQLNKDLENLTAKGLRVIAVAYKSLRITNLNELRIKNGICDLTFVGLIGLKDPLRKEVKKAFDICKGAGMKPIIVTGDHLLTAQAVAKELGLETKKENVILGEDLDKLSDEDLQKKLNKIHLFARVEPHHKLRIIKAWQEQNQVVAMTGDGINDAPALKKADIGVALGSGTDVAKESSDLVLLNDNFSVIVRAVEEGRAILDNIRKVVTYLLSDSFTEVLLIGVSIIVGIPLPVTAVQILWVNLIEDGLPSIALAFEPKEKDLMRQKPGAHNIPLLTREMKVIIFIIGLFTNLVLLGLFFWLYNKFGTSKIGYIRTMILSALTIDSLFYVFSCKSLRKNIWRINLFSNRFLIIAWLVGFLALVAALYLSPLQALLKTVPLGVFDWFILIGLGLIELISIEAAKYYFIVKRTTNI